jgi:hypothetical protein
MILKNYLQNEFHVNRDRIQSRINLGVKGAFAPRRQI